MTTLTPERRALYETIATITAGHRAGDVVAALTDNLATAAGFVSDSPEAAERLILSLVPDMVGAIRDNWPLIAANKARAGRPGVA